MLQQLVWQLREFSTFSVYTTAAMACAAFLFFREIAHSPMMALVSLPVVMAGGLISTAVFQGRMIVLAYEPNANVAAMAGVGVIAALVLMIAVSWLWVLVAERRAANTRLHSIAPQRRRII